MPDNSSFPLTVTLGNGGGDLNFDSVKDVQAWLTAEKAAWEPLRKHGANTNGIPSVMTLFDRHWNDLQSRAHTVQQHIDNKTPYNFDELRKAFNAAYRRCITSDSPKGRYILKNCHGNWMQAAAAALPMFNVALHENIYKNAFPTLFDTMVFMRGGPENLTVTEEQRAQLVKEWQTEIRTERDARKERDADHSEHMSTVALLETNLNKSHTDHADVIARLTAAHEVQIEQTTEARDNLLKDSLETLDTFLKKFKDKRQTIEDTYHAHMQLKAPVQYWRIQARSHRRESAIYARLSIWLSVILAIFLPLVAYLLLSPHGPNASLILEYKPPYYSYAMLLIVVTLALGLLRVLTRVWMSHHHLKTVANEKVAMTQTYLALTEAKRAINDKDRQLILAALFTAPGTGIVKDFGPTTAFDVVTKLVNSDKS